MSEFHRKDEPRGDTPRETEEVANAHPLARFLFLKTTFATLLAVLFLVGGAFAYLGLTKESLPDLDIPSAIVTTAWPGADPQTIEDQVTRRIEDEIATLSGLKTYSSASFDSFSVIAVEFTAESDSAEAMQRLRDAVSDAQAELPGDAEAPDIQQVSVDDRPVMTIALTGAESEAELNQLADVLQERIATIGGVKAAELGGARDEIIQILLEPERLLALGVPPTQVSQAIAAANLDQPFGDIESEEVNAVARLEGRFQSVEDLRDLPVVHRGGALNERSMRLGELATVERKFETEATRAFFSEKGAPFGRSIEISVKKTPGVDTVKLIGEIEADLEEWRQTPIWPKGAEYTVTQDESEQIWESLSGVFVNGLQAMAVVFVILFLILTWREGLIAGLSIPLSFSGALIIIWMFGYSLNELVIIGMVLALGLLVDVFILMMEGIHEEIYANRKTFGQAALATIKRYGMPAFAGQLTTVLALAPLMAIAGVSGKFIRVLPITAIACLVVAFIAALLITVPLSRHLLGRVAKKGAEVKETKADRLMGAMSARLKAWSLGATLVSKRRAMVWTAGAVGVFLISLVAATQVPVTMYPPSDGINVGVNIELPPSTTLSASQRVGDDVGEMLRKQPYVESVSKLVGRKSPFASGSILSSLEPSDAENFIGFSVTLVERGDRDKASYALEGDIREDLKHWLDANVAGARLLVTSESGGPSTDDPISVDITGDDMGELQLLSAQVQHILGGIAGATDVRDNLGSVKAELSLRPRREAADFFGLTQKDLAGQIRYALSNDKVGVFAASGVQNDLDIHLGLDWEGRGGEAGGPTRMQDLALVRAFIPGGQTVGLLSLVDPQLSEAPSSILHRDGERAITVLSKVSGANVSDVVSDLRTRLDAASADWPEGYAWSIGGESDETAETFGSAGVMLVVALVMVFAVLVIVFGSFSQAVILMTTMPLALVGTFLGFWATGMSLSFFAMVGVISLIGIVANNGIVMVATMNERLQQGATVAEAAADGAAARLRPILTTSITTVIGLVPLALGSPMYAPLCYAIIFGLVASTLLSLVIVPCLYLLLTRESQSQSAALD